MEHEDSRCLVAIVEFILSQAGKHDVSDSVLSKDLLQMGVEIESSNTIIKAFADSQD